MVVFGRIINTLSNSILWFTLQQNLHPQH